MATRVDPRFFRLGYNLSTDGCLNKSGEQKLLITVKKPKRALLLSSHKSIGANPVRALKKKHLLKVPGARAASRKFFLKFFFFQKDLVGSVYDPRNALSNLTLDITIILFFLLVIPAGATLSLLQLVIFSEFIWLVFFVLLHTLYLTSLFNDLFYFFVFFLSISTIDLAVALSLVLLQGTSAPTTDVGATGGVLFRSLQEGHFIRKVTNKAF